MFFFFCTGFTFKSLELQLQVCSSLVLKSWDGGTASPFLWPFSYRLIASLTDEMIYKTQHLNIFGIYKKMFCCLKLVVLNQILLKVIMKEYSDDNKLIMLTRFSVIPANIWYHLTWQMMLDIIMCITFLSVQIKYPATRFICQNFDK